MTGVVIIVVVFLLYDSLMRSAAGIAERKMEELYRLSTGGKVSGVDGN